MARPTRKRAAATPARQQPPAGGADFAERALAALHALAQAAGGVADPAALAMLACSSARDAIGLDHAGIFVWDEGKQALVLLEGTSDDRATQTRVRFHSGEGATGLAFARNAPVVINRYDAWHDQPAWVAGSGLLSVAAVPLRTGSRAIGALCVLSSSRHAFSTEEVHFLDLIATQIAPSIELARLAAESEHRRQQAEARAVALANSEAWLRTVFDAMGCGVNVRAVDGRLLYANQASRAILGEAQA